MASSGIDELRTTLAPPTRLTAGGGSRRWTRPAAAVAAIALGAILVGALRPTAQVAPVADGDPSVGSVTTTSIEASTSTPGTETTAMTAGRVWPVETATVAGREVRVGGRRYLVGAEGDVVAVGDWACNRLRTAAVLRPSTGVLLVFDGWADVEPALARPVAEIPDAVTIAAGATCGEAIVTSADGAAHTIDVRSR